MLDKVGGAGIPIKAHQTTWYEVKSWHSVLDILMAEAPSLCGCHSLSDIEDLQQFRSNLLGWYDVQKRELPWRTLVCLSMAYLAVTCLQNHRKIAVPWLSSNITNEGLFARVLMKIHDFPIFLCYMQFLSLTNFIIFQKLI